MKRAISPAEQHRFTAGVCASEANARRERDPSFAATLDTWAANAFRRAVEAERGEQPDLFGTGPAAITPQSRAA